MHLLPESSVSCLFSGLLGVCFRRKTEKARISLEGSRLIRSAPNWLCEEITAITDWRRKGITINHQSKRLHWRHVRGDGRVMMSWGRSLADLIPIWDTAGTSGRPAQTGDANDPCDTSGGHWTESADVREEVSSLQRHPRGLYADCSLSEKKFDLWIPQSLRPITWLKGQTLQHRKQQRS